MRAPDRSESVRRPLGLAVVVALLAGASLVGCGPQALPAPSASPIAATSSEPETGAGATPTATPATTPSPSPAHPPDPLPAGTVTALLIGTDSRTPGDLTGNSDAIVIAQLSADRETLSLVSVSRDSWVTIPGHGEAKLNASFALGGTDSLVATLSALLGGLEFDYVVQTTFDGFVGLVDAVGGVSVDNATPAVAYYGRSGEVSDTGIAYDFTADPVELVDETSIYFVRQRYGLPYGDLDRAERTRATIIGLLDRLDALAADPPALTAALVHIAGEVRVTGDLEVADMVALTALSQELERDDILSLMAPIEGFTGRAGASVNVVDVAQTAELGEALRAGDVRAYVDEHGTDYRP